MKIIIQYVQMFGAICLLLQVNQAIASLDPEPLHYKVVKVQNYLNVRNGPGTNFKVVGKLKPGADLVVEEIRGRGRNRWALYYVNTGREYAEARWASLNFLKEHSGHNLSKVFHVYTDEDNGTLNVRSGPGRNRSVLKKLSNGTIGIKILRTQKNGDSWWARIKWNGKIGWVDSYYLIETQSYTVKSGDTLYAITEKTAVDWKHIARMNKLSKPYALRIGQKLKLPRYDF